MESVAIIITAFLYNMFTYKLADTITNNDKKSFTITMICGILGITLAYTIFNEGSYKNTSLKYGLLIGSLIY